jgi:hypothetical protein
MCVSVYHEAAPQQPTLIKEHKAQQKSNVENKGRKEKQ